MKIIVFFTILSTVKLIAGIFGPNEFSIALNLVRRLEIRSCFLVSEDRNSLNFLSAGKILFKNIAMALISYEKLTKYIELSTNDKHKDGTKYIELTTHDKHTNDGIGNILMENDLARIELLSQRLDMVNHTYKMCKFRWVVFTQNSGWKPDPKKLRIPYNCEFIIIQPEATSRYRLFEYYTTTNRFFIYDFGTWNDLYGLETTDITFYWRRLDLNRTRITILAAKDTKRECIGVPYQPICQADIIIQDFSYMMNFDNYIIRLPSTVLNRFNTFIEYQAKNQANINVSPRAAYGLFEKSYKDFSFYYNLGPIFKSDFNFYIKYPKSVLRADYFIQPFHRNFWLAIISFIIIGNIFVTILCKLKTTKKSSVVDNWFLIFETFCNQINTDQMENAYLKTISVIIQFTAIIITGAFGAVIASFIAVEIIQEPFTNMDELVKNSQYKLLILYNRFGDVLFNTTYAPFYKNFHQDHVRYIYHYTGLKNYSLLCTDDRVAAPLEYAFERLFPTIKYYSETECNIYRISKPLGFPVTISLPLEQFSPFMNMFNNNLLRFYESGIQMKMQQIVDGKSIVVDKIENTFQSVKLSQMALVLSIPFIGIFLAAIIAIVELKTVYQK